MDDRHLYQLYGMTVAMPFECPELAPGDGAVAVRVHEAPVPRSLLEPSARGVRFEATREELLLRVDGVARFHVARGESITIEREDGASDDDVRVFLLGSALGALLHQRGVLPFHGSAIAVNDGAVAFLGPSGVGKSTLAASLSRRGYRVLADDVAAIALRDRSPLLIPGSPQLKLWADVAEKLGESIDHLRRVRADLEKFSLPVGRADEQPLHLRRIYVLESTNTRDLTLTELKGMEKLTVLVGNTYRLHFLGNGAGRTPNFEQCAAVAERAAVVRVVRPDTPFLLDELTHLVEQDFLR